MSFSENQGEEETGGYRKWHNRTRNNLCALLHTKIDSITRVRRKGWDKLVARIEGNYISLSVRANDDKQRTFGKKIHPVFFGDDFRTKEILNIEQKC